MNPHEHQQYHARRGVPAEHPAGQPAPHAAPVSGQPGVPGDTQYVYVTRPHEPEMPHLSDEQRRKHEESKQKYPDLNLSEGEFVISVVNRHFIGLFQIWAVVAIVLALLFGAVYYLSGSGSGIEGVGEVLPARILAIPAFLLALLALIFGMIATSIYRANKFFLTNESVIQQIQIGLFHKHEQMVSLANVEDASYQQNGILPHMLNYGLIRLSTEGEETTYRFQYATSPKKTVHILNNAVEAFKNGRPVVTPAED